MKVYLRSNGRNIAELDLPSIPRQGDIISSLEPKNARYLVLRVEFFSDIDSVNLHVKEFANELMAINDIDGFNNTR